MAYSVLSKEGKKGDIIHFLADTIEDYAFIIDTCSAGSTIEVLDEPCDEAKNPNTYMKAPSGKWVHIEGKGETELPANDAEVAIPSDDYVPGTSGLTVGEMQSNVKVYPSGLVTGTSYKMKGNKLFGSDEQDGHFVTVLIPAPEGAHKIKIKGGTMTAEKESEDLDGFLTVRLDKMRDQNKNTITITFEDESEGEVASFKFNFSQVELI